MKIIFDNLQHNTQADVFFHWASYENAALPAMYVFHRSDNSNNAIFLFENVYRSAFGSPELYAGLFTDTVFSADTVKPHVLYETINSKWLEPGQVNTYPTAGETNELFYDQQKLKHFIYRAGNDVLHLLAEKYSINSSPKEQDFYYEI